MKKLLFQGVLYDPGTATLLATSGPIDVRGSYGTYRNTESLYRGKNGRYFLHITKTSIGGLFALWPTKPEESIWALESIHDVQRWAMENEIPLKTIGVPEPEEA